MSSAPFDKSHELFSFEAVSPSNSTQTGAATRHTLVLPVVQMIGEGEDHMLQPIIYTSNDNLRRYLKDDLDVDRLNKIHKHLWFAGLPRCGRPLHHQLMIDRKIVLTERADLHFLWQDDRIYLKPLPDYLLSNSIWDEVLKTDSILFESAKGFLLSYLWLVQRKSDFMIAQKKSLINSDLSWDDWTAFSAVVTSNIDLREFSGISPRYLYGELRLGRVNMIYRLCRNTRTQRTFIRGYLYGYHKYSSFLSQNLAWVVTATVYVTVVLTAMQVGLGTSELRSNQIFNRASYGFTVFSILAPLIILLVAVFVLLILIWFNLDYTLGKRNSAREKFATVFTNAAIRPYDH
jgi:hypothetical protein